MWRWGGHEGSGSECDGIDGPVRGPDRLRWRHPAGPQQRRSGRRAPAATTPANGGANTEGLAGITFPPGAKVSDLGTNQKQYEVTGMTLEQVKTFFEDEMIAAGYTRAQEASASRFYDKGSRRIQITWSDQQGTIRGVVRVTR